MVLEYSWHSFELLRDKRTVWYQFLLWNRLIGWICLRSTSFLTANLFCDHVKLIPVCHRIEIRSRDSITFWFVSIWWLILHQELDHHSRCVAVVSNHGMVWCSCCSLYPIMTRMGPRQTSQDHDHQLGMEKKQHKHGSTLHHKIDCNPSMGDVLARQVWTLAITQWTRTCTWITQWITIRLSGEKTILIISLETHSRSLESSNITLQWYTRISPALLHWLESEAPQLTEAAGSSTSLSFSEILGSGSTDISRPNTLREIWWTLIDIMWIYSFHLTYNNFVSYIALSGKMK